MAGPDLQSLPGEFLGVTQSLEHLLPRNPLHHLVGDVDGDVNIVVGELDAHEMRRRDVVRCPLLTRVRLGALFLGTTNGNAGVGMVIEPRPGGTGPSGIRCVSQQ